MRAPSARVRIGFFELDIRSGELRSLASDAAADRILLREQPFQILRLLVEREGKIVTRSEIRKRLWPNDTIVDFDHSINVAIGVLRRALGDSAVNPRYIETLARRGYRLLAAVEWQVSGPPPDEAGVGNDTPPLGDLTGRKVCHYRVLEVLGGGGMGMVYKAEDLKLGRRVALKFLPEELAGDPSALQRLEREAQTASALNHPNICTIHDIDEYAGQPFIAMELLEGETLQQRIAASASDPVPLLTLIDIASQVCLGLEAAHGKDIVHRDIKPANVFLTKAGPVKLLDFGVAKLAASGAVADLDTVEHGAGGLRPRLQPGLTRTGTTPGTTGYMSPEQVRKEALDGRSDLFSLGLVLYEMATGRRAFAGETALAVHDAILTRTPPAVQTINAAVPRGLVAVVAKALEKDRMQRYQTAADMRHDLERERRELLQPGGRRLRRWVPAAAAVLAIAGTAGWFSASGVTGVTLTANDTIVIAHLTNATSDRVFDEALYTALRIALEQTPYLNVLADNKVRETAATLGIDNDARMTPEVALQVCRHTGSRVVVAPAIADAGNRLRLELKAMDCRSGSAVSEIGNEAASRDGVVAALGTAAVQLRRELGEPASSMAAYDVPLQEATSSSPEALELLTLGYRRQLAGSSQDAIPFYQRAAQADPNLALAHAALSTAHTNVGETALAAASGRTAFALRERLTVPAHFNVESTYHRQVNGDWESNCTVLSQWVQAFPSDVIARNNFGVCLSVLGEQDRALGEWREAARLLPAPFTYAAWIGQSLLADRVDEAQTVMDEARRRGFDSPLLRDLRVKLGFFRKDDAAMQQEWAWAAGRAEAHQVVMGKAMVEAYYGRLRAALRSADAAAALAEEAGSAADYAISAALLQAEVGLSPTRLPIVAANHTRSARLLGALALARTGHTEEATRVADALRHEFPLNTIVQRIGLPLIDGAVKLRSGDAAGAVRALEQARKYDLADTVLPALYPAYVRGSAHLQAGEAAAAAAEFQRILRHPGLVGRSVIGPLARLQLARAQHAMGDDTAALESYQAFLDLWQDADADIPVYRAARAEYLALRSRHATNEGRP